MRLRLVVGEALRSLRASMSTTMAATVTVLIGMFVLGLAIALGSWVLSWSDHVKKQLEVKVYFQPTATGKQIDNVRILLSTEPLKSQVKSFRFVSKNAALAEMRRKVPDIVKNLAYNPLPASYEVIPRNAEDISAISREIRQSSLPGVDKVKNGGDTSKRVLKVGKYIELIFLVAVIVLLVASTLLIANTIRLSIFARRREIEVMKLVGATNWFVRGPFMLEGLLCGLVGSLAAVLLLVVGDSVALPALSIGHSKNAHALALELNALIIVGTGLLLGAAGSGLTLRRFLRV
jgi:cell division transport system permease protein